MEILDDLAQAELRQETILTIGAFDGVHRGHQALIGQVVQRARETDRLAALITFHPHPVRVLAPDRAPPYLTTPGEKVVLLEALGIDLVFLLPFSREVAATPARDFVQQVVEHLRLRELWVGADFALGRNREGDVPCLRELGREFGFEVHAVQPVQEADGVISSSRIRRVLAEGRVAEAARLLGRYPSLSGEVVVGAQRGRTLGFPTANLEVRAEQAVPANGVYAVFARLGAERYAAVANVGVRPSFDNGERIVETHIFDFERDIYGCDLVVEFVARLRDERRFADIDDLVAQIGEDSQAARQILDGDQVLFAADSLLLAACTYRYREVEHTADRALYVWGQTLPDLFAGAAAGMYSLMGDLDDEGEGATQWHAVSLQADDAETLLVDWLNELLYLTEMEEALFADIRLKSLGDGTLEALVGGLSARVTKADIKAATFHNLQIAAQDGGWAATITFDV